MAIAAPAAAPQPAPAPAPVAAVVAPPASPAPAEATGSAAADNSSLAVHITHVAAGWSSARLQAFIERTGVRPKSVSKQVGQDHAQATFASEQDRVKAMTELQGLRMGGQTTMNVTVFAQPAPAAQAAPAASAAAAAGGLPALPAAAAPAAAGAAAAQGTKRPATPAQQQQGSNGQWSQDGRAAKKARPEDVRDVVCPLYTMPYSQQLETKLQTVTKTLGQVTRMVGEGIPPVSDYIMCALQEHAFWIARMPRCMHSTTPVPMMMT